MPHSAPFHEGPLRDHLEQWAISKGLTAIVDQPGNLIIRKPASAGREHFPGVILQAHLDMVCQENNATTHDFLTDPICPVVRDGLLLAEDTTLGADNGIGVVLALAALEDSTLVHGPLEALLTVDEEEGMGGVQGLAGTLAGPVFDQSRHRSVGRVLSRLRGRDGCEREPRGGG